MRRIRAWIVFAKPLRFDGNLVFASISQLGVSPGSNAAENTPTDTPKKPPLQVNPCGRIRPQANSRNGTSAIAVSDLRRKIRTHTDASAQKWDSNLVAEEGSTNAT